MTAGSTVGRRNSFDSYGFVGQRPLGGSLTRPRNRKHYICVRCSGPWTTYESFYLDGSIAYGAVRSDIATHLVFILWGPASRARPQQPTGPWDVAGGAASLQGASRGRLVGLQARPEQDPLALAS